VDGLLEVLPILTRPEKRRTKPPQKLLVPQPVEPVLRKQGEGERQLLAHDQEMSVWAAAQPGGSPPILKQGAGTVLVCLNEIPIGNVLHAIHTYAINPKIPHPTRDVAIQQGARGRLLRGAAADGIVGRLRKRPRTPQ